MVRDNDGKPYAVRDHAVNSMLLDEFLKEHRKAEKSEATLESLAAVVREHAALLQKVSGKVGMNKLTVNVVSTNP